MPLASDSATSIAALQSQLTTGELTCRELVARAVAATERHANLTAYRVYDEQTMLAEADRAQALIQSGRHTALTGLPVSVKDVFAIDGYDCFAGMAQPVPCEWWAGQQQVSDTVAQQGPVIDSIRRRDGGIIAGITHAAELAVGGVGVNAHWGAPRNPWDAEHHRVAGGSSSGAAISVISGSCVYALGTDTGGSVRVPASAAGVVGLKTSSKLWPVDGIVPLASRFDSVGVLTHSVADVIAVYSAINHGLYGDTSTPSVSLSGASAYRDFSFRRASPLAWAELDNGIGAALEAALDECVQDGMQLEDDDEGLFEEAAIVRDKGPNTAAYETYRLVSRVPDLIDSLSPYVQDFLQSASEVTPEVYYARLAALMAFRHQVSQRMGPNDIIVSPTLRWTPPRWDALDCESTYARYSDGMLHNTVLASVSGMCAISLPVGLDACGLPVGLQLSARADNDDGLLRAALCIERTIGTGLQRCGIPPMLQRAL